VKEDLVVGIDLGTTFSAVSYIDEHGKPIIVANSEGERTTPSVIFFQDGGDPVVGRAAHNQALFAPERVVTSVKREMGNPSFRKSVDGKDFLPEELSAIILKKLKSDAEARLGCEVKRAVVSVPAYFKDAQREATRQAAQLAGLEVVRMLNEPTAAALAYGLEKVTGKQTILVYDFGGGTFDATVMAIDGRKFTILGSRGNARLGGEDLTKRLSDFLAESFQRDHGFDPRLDPVGRQDLWDRAEQAKRDLSFRENVVVTMAVGDRLSKIDLSSATFRNLIQDLIEETKTCIETLLNETGHAWPGIDAILLVGGSSRIPSVREMITQVSGKEPSRDVNPDECVAMGAAIQTLIEIQEGDRVDPGHAVDQRFDLVVHDVTSHGLGVKALSSDRKTYINKTIIPKYTPVPCARSQVFLTNEDNQPIVEVEVLQGDDPNPSSEDVDFVGRLRLADLPPHKAGELKIEVTLRYDADGVVVVMARELASGKMIKETLMQKTGALSSRFLEESKAELDRIVVQ
jgi:molecular chaperone DnaK